jgi:hypothetical protein
MEEIFQNNDNLSKQIRDIHPEYFSKEKILENKKSEILIDVQAEKNCCVLVTPTMVQTSVLSDSQGFETASPVSYFDSLTPDLRDSDYKWNYKSIDRVSSKDERSINDENNFDRNLNSQDVNDEKSICNNMESS